MADQMLKLMLEPILEKDAPDGVEQQKQAQTSADENKRVVVGFSRHGAPLANLL